MLARTLSCKIWVPKCYACKDTAQAENDRLRGRRDDDNSRIQRVKLFSLLLSQSVFTPLLRLSLSLIRADWKRIILE